MIDVKKYPFIDALRGLAVLAVLFTHSANVAMPIDVTLNWFVQLSANGVQLFYIASSIAICMSWDAKNIAGNSSKFDFYLRRFFRIAPMFYLSIILYLFVDGLSSRYWAPNGIELWFVFVTVFFLHGFHPETINSIVPGGWSIAVEVIFYAIFPLAATVLKNYRVLIILLILSILFLNIGNDIYQEIFQYSKTQAYLLESFTYLNFFGQLPIFLMGIISYFHIKKSFNKLVFYLVIAGFLTVIFFEKDAYNFVRLFLPVHVIFGFVFALLAMYLSVNPLKILVNMVTIKLGHLSYSIYLLHHAVLHFFGKSGLTHYLNGTDWGSIFHFLLLVFVTTSLAVVTFYLIEKPGIDIGLWFRKNIPQKFIRT